MLFKKDKQAASTGSENSLQEKMIEKEEAAATKERMAEELIQGKISLFKNPLAVATAQMCIRDSCNYLFGWLIHKVCGLDLATALFGAIPAGDVYKRQASMPP